MALSGPWYGAERNLYVQRVMGAAKECKEPKEKEEEDGGCTFTSADLLKWSSAGSAGASF